MNNAQTNNDMNFITAELGELIMLNIIKGMDIELATAQAHIDYLEALLKVEGDTWEAKGDSAEAREAWSEAADARYNFALEIINKYGMDNYSAQHMANKNDRAQALLTGDSKVRVRNMKRNGGAVYA
jgi:hypothetical protein